MAVSERIIKRIFGWSLGICIVGPAVVVSAWMAIDQLRTWHVCSQFTTASQANQLRWLNQASIRRDRRFANITQAILHNSNDRALLQTAGGLALRIEAIDLLPLIQKRADEGPDDVQRAQLIISAARLSDGDIRLSDWLMRGVQSSEPWRRAGSAIGLLHIGRPESGPLVIEIIRKGPEETQALSMQNLTRIARPLGQAVGHPLPCLDASPLTCDANSLDQIGQFWQNHVTTKLLNDVLRRLADRDPDWAEMGRLIHARDMVTKWLQ